MAYSFVIILAIAVMPALYFFGYGLGIDVEGLRSPDTSSPQLSLTIYATDKFVYLEASNETVAKSLGFMVSGPRMRGYDEPFMETVDGFSSQKFNCFGFRVIQFGGMYRMSVTRGIVVHGPAILLAIAWGFVLVVRSIRVGKMD